MKNAYGKALLEERLAFAHYLRTGRRPQKPIEVKFNPYHDPRNGQFTFAPGGPRSLSHILVSGRDGGRRLVASAEIKPEATQHALNFTRPQNAVLSSSEIPRLTLASVTRNPRARAGNNGGPPLNDPVSLIRVFPGIATSPAGSIIAAADYIFDLTDPGNSLTSELMEGHANYLITQIRAIDPNYRFDSLGFPTTFEGQENLISRLRTDRAAAAYRIKGEVRPLQVETLRRMQQWADQAYDEAVAKYERGELRTRLSQREAIGNFVDAQVRHQLRMMYRTSAIDQSENQNVRVNRREYNSSQSELSFRLPDARVGKVAFDVTLTRKTLSTPQVKDFFEADFRPETVIIIRPSQLGMGNTYAITQPRPRK